MNTGILVDLLYKKPGYVAVRALMDGPKRREKLADITKCNGGTLNRWIEAAEDQGVIDRTVSICNEEKCVIVELRVDIPDSLVNEISHRGRKPRHQQQDHADSRAAQHYLDEYPNRPER